MDGIKKISRASHHWGRLSRSEATPPVSTPIAAAGQPGYRRGVRSCYSRSMLSPPPSSEPTKLSRRDPRLSIDNPWLGERLESPPRVPYPKPATRGEMMLFRRAEELWKSTAKARQEARQCPPTPTLEQRLAKLRNAEAWKRRPQAIRINQHQRLDGDCGASGGSSASGSRLEEKYVSDNKLPYAAGNGPLCFMDIEIGGESVGRLVFRLFADKTPKTSENFRVLCTGEHGRGLRYEGSAFHRIVPGFVAQGGDFTTGDGRGGKSIYGGKFEDECFMRHHKSGLLSMANSGPNTNGSQFFITLKATAHLDGKHVVFGELQTGFNVLDRMKSVQLEPRSEGKPAPHQRVVIACCGQLQEDGKNMPGVPGQSSLPSGGRDSIPPLNQPTSQSSIPVLGCTTALGDQPRGVLFGAAPAAATGHTAHSTFSALGASAGGGAGVASSSSGDARQLGGGDLFRPALTAPVLSFGTLPSTAAAPFRRSEGTERSISGDPTGAGSSSPLNTTSDAIVGPSTVVSSFASLAAAISDAPPVPHSGFARPGVDATSSPGAKRTSAESGPGDGTDREKQSVVPPALKAAPETAFDGLDRACTGWVGHADIEALVGMVGLSYRSEEHGVALLKLCSLRLPRKSFVEWFRSATANEQQREQTLGASGVEDSRAGLQQARAGTTSTAVKNETAEHLASTGVQNGADAATSAVPLALKKREATEFPQDGSKDDQSSGSGKGDGSDDGDSDDGDEVDDVERQEERPKAGEAFDEVDSTGRGWVVESQFGALMKAVGTTYSVENHKPRLLSVCREKRLEREVFLAWYDGWLFGEDDSSDGEGEEGKGDGAVSKTEGFASLLASQADMWKCRVCLVFNPESAVKCLSCETAKSGKDGIVSDSATSSSKSSPGSVFGLSFGSRKETDNLTFESPPAPASAATSLQVSSVSSASGGFTFGGPPAGAPVSVVLAASPRAGGFGVEAPIATSASVAPASATTAPVVHPAASAGEVVDEDTKADDRSSGRGKGDGSDDDGGSNDDELDGVERQEERAKARKAFDEVDSTGRGWVEESQFEALMEAVGTTYSVEVHKPKLLSVCREKRLGREVFLTWYNWLSVEAGSSNGEGEVGKKRKMGTEEGSSALGRVADEETLNASRSAWMGDAKMRVLNKKFKTEAAKALEEDNQIDLTSMVSHYLTYSTRINRSYLADHGQVFMCGNGDCGQLGFGTKGRNNMEIKVPRLLPRLAKQKVVTVLCGGIATAALTEGGRVYTWGSSDDGGLGRQCGREAPEQFPGQVKGGLDGALVVGLDCGDCHMVALDISGKVYGWGCYKDKEGNQWFQPPEGKGVEAARKASEFPVEIQGLPRDVVEVKCGASFCLALTSKGEVFSWGIGELGELGRNVCAMKVPPPPGSEEEPSYDFSGIARDHLTPGHMYRSLRKDGPAVVRMKGVKAIGCGEYHSMVVTRGDSGVYTCGLNSYGQLGLGDTRNRKHLTMVESLNGRNAMVVAGGAQHSLVLTIEGLFSFGRNDSGQLGCTETLSRENWGAFETLPMEVHLPVGAGKPLRLKCGTNHCLVMTDTHELYTWGYGDTCALGHGSDDDFSLPRKVDTERQGIIKVLDADGGGQHTAIVGETAENS